MRSSKPKKTSGSSNKDQPKKLPQPVNVYDGIPDRAARPSRKRLLLVAGLFVAWVAFLVAFLLIGRARP
jgi:hypothetical protein